MRTTMPHRLARGLAVAALAALAAPPAGAQAPGTSPPPGEASLAALIAEAEETPERRALAERPEVARDFARYRAEGGLLPRLRFAEEHALTVGFADPRAPSVAALGLLDALTPGRGMSDGERADLRDRPLAFDLVCAAPAGGWAGPAEPLDVGGVVPAAGAALRVSVDVPARLWRVEGGPLQAAAQGARGRLVVRPPGSLRESAWGELAIERLAPALVDSRSVTEAAPPNRRRENRFRAACRVEPFSRLFGSAAPP